MSLIMYINQSITGLGHCIHTTVFPVTLQEGQLQEGHIHANVIRTTE